MKIWAPPCVATLPCAKKRVSIQSTAVSTAVSTAAFEQLLGPAVNARLNSCWGPLLTRVNTSGSTLLAQLGEHCLNVNPWCLPLTLPFGQAHGTWEVLSPGPIRRAAYASEVQTMLTVREVFWWFRSAAVWTCIDNVDVRACSVTSRNVRPQHSYHARYWTMDMWTSPQ